MVARDVDVYYDPYDFEIDADPYPVWKRLRDERPLYHNARYGFYALSRFDDVHACLVDWRTYRPLYMDAAIPRIEIVLLNRPDMPACGAGETSVTVTAGALANAIFDATGARLRQVPFTPARVQAALAARRL